MHYALSIFSKEKWMERENLLKYRLRIRNQKILVQLQKKEAFNRTVRDFLTLARDHQGDSNNLEDSISDFLLYYNNRKHSATKVAPYKAMMNIGDKALMNEIKCNTIQRRSKAKMSSETFQENSYVIVLNYTRIWMVHSLHQPLGIQELQKKNVL